MLKIGVSACYFHPDPQRPVFKGKTLLYMEQSLGHWIQSGNALPFLIPSANSSAGVQLRDFITQMDGLVLHGGADVSPESYGEKPLRPEWSGDAIRDRYEIELLKETLAQKKPVLAVCRGAQLVNVAFGGTLIQDIGTQIAGALTHRNWEVYDQNMHSITIEPQSRLSRIYPKNPSGKVNSVHHQAIRDLGKDLVVEARSEKDGIIEAVRLESSDQYLCAIQWHPEFHNPNDKSLLDSAALLQDFLDEVRRRKT